MEYLHDSALTVSIQNHYKIMVTEIYIHVLP